MANQLSKVFTYLLILAAIVMLGWGVLGSLEYFFGVAPVMPLQNPTFPTGTQFIHWVLITLSGVIFLVGYFRKWKYTPIAMMIIYGMLATLCAIETFDFMVIPSRYSSFVREYLAYIGISVYLVRSQRMRSRFGRIEMIAGQT